MAAWVPRVASQYSAKRPPTATKRSVFLDDFDRILAASRSESAIGAKQWTDPDLIKSNQLDEERCEKTAEHRPKLTSDRRIHKLINALADEFVATHLKPLTPLVHVIAGLRPSL